MEEDDAMRARRRRWHILREDGSIFGLTAHESVELARLEREFGDSGLSQKKRSPSPANGGGDD